MVEVSLECQNIDCQELYEGDAEDSYDTYWFTCPKCGCENEQVQSWK
jgi:Zn finger protein HypA/HybF involved in hydrogenase expression